jgi:hypothetical protein
MHFYDLMRLKGNCLESFGGNILRRISVSERPLMGYIENPIYGHNELILLKNNSA